MNKYVILLAGVLICTTFDVNAQQYVRKKVQPDFFIPTKELERQEKLPQFPAIESGAIKVSKGRVMVKTYDEIEEDKHIDENKPQKNIREIISPRIIQKPVVAFALPDERPIPPAETPKKETEYSIQDGLGDELSKNEEYIAKEKAYEKDLQVLAQTGNLPKNSQLEADLEKMSDSLSFRVK